MPSWETPPPGLRDQYYSTLFAGELPYEPPPPEAAVSISGLCRTTRQAGAYAHGLRDHIEALPGIIDSILTEHDQAVRRDGEGIFAFRTVAAQQQVGSIVTRVFTRWEVIYSRRRLTMLLPDKESDARWLVVETAAAAMAAGTPRNGFRLDKNPSDTSTLATILANWGPRFIQQWFDGTILTQWMDEQRMPPAKQAEWQGILTPNVRKRFAISSLPDPLQALAKVVFNRDTLLTDTRLAKFLNISEADARAMFTPGDRTFLAIHNIAAPLEGAAQVKAHLQVTLSDQNIAAFLGWDEADVREIFPPSIRKLFAIRHMANPLKGCRDWANGTISIGGLHGTVRDRKLRRRQLRQ